MLTSQCNIHQIVSFKYRLQTKLVNFQRIQKLLAPHTKRPWLQRNIAVLWIHQHIGLSQVLPHPLIRINPLQLILVKLLRLLLDLEQRFIVILRDLPFLQCPQLLLDRLLASLEVLTALWILSECWLPRISKQLLHTESML